MLRKYSTGSYVEIEFMFFSVDPNGNGIFWVFI